MKTVSTLRPPLANANRSNIYLAQAWYRKRFWFDFRVEFELIGAQLNRLRRREGYNIETAAKAAGMRAYKLYKIEQGVYIHFELRHLQRLGRLYNTTTREILSVIPHGVFGDS